MRLVDVFSTRTSGRKQRHCMQSAQAGDLMKKILLPLVFLLSQFLQAQQPTHYEPTIESLDRHPLPDWYADAKAGHIYSLGTLFRPRLGPAGSSRSRFHIAGLHHTQSLCGVVLEEHAAR